MVDGSKKQIPGGDLSLLPNLEICNSNPLAGWMLRVNRLIWILVQPSYTLKKAWISSPSTYHLSMLKRPVCGVICHHSDIWYSHLIWFRQFLLSSWDCAQSKVLRQNNSLFKSWSIAGLFFLFLPGCPRWSEFAHFLRAPSSVDCCPKHRTDYHL